MVVTGEGPRRSEIMYACECDCGRVVAVRGKDFRQGKTQSCGCARNEHTQRMGAANRVHGHASGARESATYYSWRAMIRRCTDPRAKDYARYGARGVTVCRPWLAFAAFLKDMGERPKGRTLDRKDGTLGYTPDNCQWATPKQQANNRRYSHPRYVNQ